MKHEQKFNQTPSRSKQNFNPSHWSKRNSNPLNHPDPQQVLNDCSLIKHCLAPLEPSYNTHVTLCQPVTAAFKLPFCYLASPHSILFLSIWCKLYIGIVTIQYLWWSQLSFQHLPRHITDSFLYGNCL